MQVIIPPKAKADFEKHLKKYWYVIMSISFQSLPFEMQSGVYLAYLRERGIEPSAQRDISGKTYFGHVALYFPFLAQYDDFETSYAETHPEALTAAINAAFLRVEETLND